MGRFFDYLTGGNEKVAAMSLVKFYKEFSAECSTEDEVYLSIYNAYMITLIPLANTEKNIKTLDIMNKLGNNLFKNYVDLVVLELNLRAAPTSVKYDVTYNDFHHKIAELLRSKNIPDQYIYGDNRHLSK